MPKTEITGLPDIGSVDGDELFPCRDALGDVKITLDQIATHTKDAITPAETLAHVIAANPETSGLNANLLQGLLASYFTNASNLNAGTVPNSNLPLGEFNTSWSSGGAYPAAGSLRGYWKIPEFIAGIGNRIMIQFGWTNFIGENEKLTTTYLTPFASGWGTENSPMLQVTPQCRSNSWPTEPSTIKFNVELDMRVASSTMSSFKVYPIRNSGGDPDKVRANWWAIGKY